MTTRRRNLLTLAALSATAWPLPSVSAAQRATRTSQQFLDVPKTLQSQFNKLFGTAPIPQQQISLSLPALAENGNSVALGVTIEPIQAHPKKLYVFAEKNPLPDILRCEFSAPQVANSSSSRKPIAQNVDTRIRLSDSQRIIAVAEYSNGTLSSGEASIVVTLAACIDLPE